MIITLEGMRFKSPLGYYDEEQTVGTDIIIDLEVELYNPPLSNDQLSRTMNYETLYDFTRKAAAKPFRIIESYCTEIINMIILQLRVNRIKVKVSKLHPPLPGVVEKASVTVERTF